MLIPLTVRLTALPLLQWDNRNTYITLATTPVQESQCAVTAMTLFIKWLGIWERGWGEASTILQSKAKRAQESWRDWRTSYRGVGDRVWTFLLTQHLAIQWTAQLDILFNQPSTTRKGEGGGGRGNESLFFLFLRSGSLTSDSLLLSRNGPRYDEGLLPGKLLLWLIFTIHPALRHILSLHCSSSVLFLISAGGATGWMYKSCVQRVTIPYFHTSWENQCGGDLRAELWATC